MSTQLGGRGDGGAEEEEDVQGVKEKWEKSVTLEGVAPGGRDQIEQRQHGEGCHEDVVVDEGRVTGKGHGNDVANEGHGDEGEDELQGWVAQVSKLMALVSVGKGMLEHTSVPRRMRLSGRDTILAVAVVCDGEGE